MGWLRGGGVSILCWDKKIRGHNKLKWLSFHEDYLKYGLSNSKNVRDLNSLTFLLIVKVGWGWGGVCAFHLVEITSLLLWCWRKKLLKTINLWSYQLVVMF